MNNSGTVQASEAEFWRPAGASEGNVVAIPPRGLTTLELGTPLFGPGLRCTSSLPSITFHRNGSASSDAEIYVANGARGEPQFRVVTLVRAISSD